MFSISPALAALAKRASKAFSSANVMFSCLRPPFAFWVEVSRVFRTFGLG